MSLNGEFCLELWIGGYLKYICITTKPTPARRPLTEAAALEHLTKHGGRSAGQSTPSLTTVTACITWERDFFNLVDLGSFLGLYISFIY